MSSLKAELKKGIAILSVGVAIGACGLEFKAYLESPHNHIGVTDLQLDCAACGQELVKFVARVVQKLDSEADKPKAPPGLGPLGPPAPNGPDAK